MNQIEMDVARSQIRANKAIASLAEVNWEQRRYEIAKEVLPALMNLYLQKEGNYFDDFIDDLAEDDKEFDLLNYDEKIAFFAVQNADALIAELKKEVKP